MASAALVFPDSWGRLAGVKLVGRGGWGVPLLSLALGPFKADYMELAVP